jgi:DNA-binding NarL/FixJ family response regulator
LSSSPPNEELEVIRMMAQGLTDRTIANRLGVSMVTIRRRVRQFRNRVGARNRTHAIAIAACEEWIGPDECREAWAASYLHDA